MPKKKFIRKCPICKKLLKYNRKMDLIIQKRCKGKCRSCAQMGKRNPQFGKPAWNTGKTLSASYIRKIRLSCIKRIQSLTGQANPNYNPEACKIIDEYGKNHGYNFQHAMNGGELHIKELGYFVDGYDKEKNTVIEYYECKWHRGIKKIKRDRRRKKEIIKHLNCKFIELYEH